MCFFKRLVQPLIIGQLDLDPVVLSQDRLCGILPFPEIRASGLFEQFSRSRG
jgi:hypothetical protein